MGKWYIDQIELAAETLVTSRELSSQWSSVIDEIRHRKAVVQTTARKPTQVVLNIQLRGDDRYAKESSIRSEIENSPSVWVESTRDYLYEDKRYGWVVPTGFNVTDEGSKRPLKCVMTGFIDERTINSCQYTTGWSTDGSSVSADNMKQYWSTADTKNAPYVWAKVGQKLICTYLSGSQSPVKTTWTAFYPIDLSESSALCLWLYTLWCDESSITSIDVGLTGSSSTEYADALALLDDFTGEYQKWLYVEIPLSNYAAVDLSSITKVTVSAGGIGSATGDYSLGIGWVWRI